MLLLNGNWKLSLNERSNHVGQISIPGSLQFQGYGNDVKKDTEFISGLHDPIWYEREEYKFAQDDEVNIPFLSQPKKHFLGKAYYKKQVLITEETSYILQIEVTKQRSTVWVDGEKVSEDFSLCTAHEHKLGTLLAGSHEIEVLIDNTMIYPYRPDGHGVTDGVGATFNGMIGKVALLTSKELASEKEKKQEYAKMHPVHIEIKDGKFFIDGKPEFLRGTHYAGENIEKGYPDTSYEWWERLFKKVKEWGLNFIRFHSYCPPEMAFCAADKEQVYLQVECGMWNVFGKNLAMNKILEEETKRILSSFGHHPSFVLFAPSNEPGGEWYETLQEWVRFAKEYDKELGYENRRVYTSQAGWPYNKAPKDVEGTDYLYFHNSGFGPAKGRIRGPIGWKGKDYNASIVDVNMPVISHELGQWTSYPDFDIIETYGDSFLQPGNYKIFKESAKAKGLLSYNKKFAKCSGKLQAMLYKEDIEAQFRTSAIYGFELLDLHDYVGQGAACVGVLDPFFNEKGMITAEKWREFCNDKMVLARMPKYVFKNTEKVKFPVELCDFRSETRNGENQQLEEVELDFSHVKKSTEEVFSYSYEDVKNTYPYTVFVKNDIIEEANVLYTKDFEKASRALEQGKKVIYSPNLSELDYSCPPLSFLTVFWNAQMGPQWSRGMGMICEISHPIFKKFPTKEYGGWQWEDIFQHGRAFNLSEAGINHEPVVRIIDDHNRNLNLGLIAEGRVGKGSLLIVSANLEGDFEERPAAYALKEAIYAYACSSEFAPTKELDMKKLESLLLANNSSYFYEDGNPENIKTLDEGTLPVNIEIPVKAETKINGIVYMANQKDRMHIGDIKTIEVYADEQFIGKWNFKSTVCQQKIQFAEQISAKKISIRVTETYQKEGVTRWQVKQDGWHSYRASLNGIVSFSILGLITDDKVVPSDSPYWTEIAAKPATAEIFI